MSDRLVGESLMPLINDGQPPEFDMVVTEKKVWSGSDLRFGFRTDDWKYLYDGTDETALLYDLQADPKETENVIHDYPEVAERFQECLQNRIECIEQTSADVSIPNLNESAGVDERLRALGYKY
jgi:arylsulfatase A-like enzyme